MECLPVYRVTLIDMLREVSDSLPRGYLHTHFCLIYIKYYYVAIILTVITAPMLV